MTELLERERSSVAFLADASVSLSAIGDYHGCEEESEEEKEKLNSIRVRSTQGLHN
jgi:hypothetical protein